VIRQSTPRPFRRRLTYVPWWDIMEMVCFVPIRLGVLVPRNGGTLDLVAHPDVDVRRLFAELLNFQLLSSQHRYRNTVGHCIQGKGMSVRSLLSRISLTVSRRAGWCRAQNSHFRTGCHNGIFPPHRRVLGNLNFINVPWSGVYLRLNLLDWWRNRHFPELGAFSKSSGRDQGRCWDSCI
jgi:hypothetical protein